MSAVWETTAALAGKNRSVPSDDKLVRDCIAGNEEAWATLIDKYKHLIYSVPARRGASPQDSADVFQAVCLELFAELPRLRRVESLRGWLLTVASHKLYHLRREQRHPVASLDDEQTAIEEPVVPPGCELEEIERNQLIREAIFQLSPRCRDLVQLLFYEQPARPYREVARQLGIAVGSIGIIRARCLTHLKRALRDLNL